MRTSKRAGPAPGIEQRARAQRILLILLYFISDVTQGRTVAYVHIFHRIICHHSVIRFTPEKRLENELDHRDHALSTRHGQPSICRPSIPTHALLYTSHSVSITVSVILFLRFFPFQFGNAVAPSSLETLLQSVIQQSVVGNSAKNRRDGQVQSS